MEFRACSPAPAVKNNRRNQGRSRGLAAFGFSFTSKRQALGDLVLLLEESIWPNPALLPEDWEWQHSLLSLRGRTGAAIKRANSLSGDG